MSDRDVDLKRFCSEDRNTLLEPFNRAGYTWATDGKILLRVPLRIDVPEREDAPHAERVWTKPTELLVPIKPFDLPVPSSVECAECSGRGTEHDCPDCSCECEVCEGKGRIDDQTYVSVGEHAAMPYRDALKILSLPGLEAEALTDVATRLHFRFRGGEGIVMLMHSMPSKHKIVADLVEDGLFQNKKQRGKPSDATDNKFSK